MKILVVGDVHGMVGRYWNLVKSYPYSLQLGDMTLNYTWLKENVPPCHRFIPGNHDHYHNLPPHSLGDFGVVPFVPESFFIRGAASIPSDRAWRTPGLNWFPEEELTLQEQVRCEKAYLETKPRIVFTHDCPLSLVHLATSMPGLKLPPISTQLLLQRLWEQHEPEQWFFGHYHKDMWGRKGKTEFQCLNELSYVELEVPG